jgi:hypothetical protein
MLLLLLKIFFRDEKIVVDCQSSKYGAVEEGR